jgi:hypothetical protein|tara:strand:+ start:218 stop:406 length:189 start_codon:yes stop_codon:yes gene_type:complete
MVWLNIVVILVYSVEFGLRGRAKVIVLRLCVEVRKVSEVAPAVAGVPDLVNSLILLDFHIRS